MGRAKAEKKARREKQKQARRMRRWLVGGAALVVVIGGAVYYRPRTQVPQVGDHWHAKLEIVICGKREPPLPPSPGGIHAHGGNDEQIHIHPASGADSGTQANLGRFFDGLKIRFTASMIELPGGRLFKEGDPCPDGNPGDLEVRVNDRRINYPRAYVPQDGDRIQIRFGS
ncbi:MAG: hypothetical protein V3U41_08715 [candidate division NC10 bacterium]